MRLKKIKEWETFPFKPYTPRNKHGEPENGGTLPSKEIPIKKNPSFPGLHVEFSWGVHPRYCWYAPGFWAPSVNPLIQRLGDGIIAW